MYILSNTQNGHYLKKKNIPVEPDNISYPIVV